MLAAPQGFEQVSKGMDVISNWVRIRAIPLAAIGAVSMALLQTLKNTFHLRRRFQRRHIEKWIASRAPVGGAVRACEDLVTLVDASDDTAFFDASVEDLCGRFKGVVSVMLDYPELHQCLLRCLAKGVEPEDIDFILMPPAADLFLKPAHLSSSEEKEMPRKYAAAKLRIGNQVGCSVDALQSSVSFRWKYWLQSASLILSGILGVIALYAGALWGPPDPGGSGNPPALPRFEAALIIGLLSGFPAPVARDLVAAVEKWRS